MAVDMFLKLDGIDGESEDDKHAKSIDVLAWSWGMSQSGTTHVGGGGGAGKANFQDLSCTKWLDKSTPVLMQHCANGKHIKDGKLTVRKAGETPLEYFILEMTELIVSSVSTGGSGGEDRLTENCSLNFREFQVTYQAQSSSGGKEGGPVKFAWNIAKNVKK